MKHYLVYQITNLVNQKIYIGVHITENIDDCYMGSGKTLKKALKKYGIENFKKVILFDFDNPEEMVAKEAELVDRKFTARKDTYNIKLGGSNAGIVCVKDDMGETHWVKIDDERWLNKQLKGVASGQVTVRSESGKCFNVSVYDTRYLSGELVPARKNKLCAKDKNGKVLSIDVGDERFKSGELVSIVKGKVLAKDGEGNSCLVSVNDERFATVELVYYWVGRNHKEETKSLIGAANSIHQAGEKNSQYGTCWIKSDKESIKIKKTELESYLEKGWVRGRQITI